MADRRRSTLLVSSLVVAALPKCPACLFAYLGLAGVLTIPQSAWVFWRFPLLVGMLILALGGPAVRAWRRRSGCCSTGLR